MTSPASSSPPAEPTLDTVLADLRRLYGDSLRAVCLYGSGTTADFVPGRSNVNLLVVLERLGLDELRRAIPHLPRWARLGVVPPLFGTWRELRDSGDVFPLERLELQARHRTLYGEDPFQGPSPDRDSVRRQCEQELRGKLIHLRQGFLEAGSDVKGLRALLGRVLPALVPLLRGLLYLKGGGAAFEVAPLLSAVEAAYGISLHPFASLHSLKRATREPSPSETEKLFGEVLTTLEELGTRVDAASPEA